MRYLMSNLTILIQIYRYVWGVPKHYVEGREKSKLFKCLDLLWYYVREREFFGLYYATGCNLEGTDCSDYIGKNQVFKLKGKADSAFKQRYKMQLNYDVLTKDKFIAGCILSANGYPCLHDLGLILNNQILMPNGTISPLKNLYLMGSDLVLKNTVLEASEGVIFVKITADKIFVNQEMISLEQLAGKLKNGIWVVQHRIDSHTAIRKVNSTALNVIRIVTVFNGDSPELIGGFQAFATGTAETDSWSEGSLYVGVDFTTAKLHKYAFRSPWHAGEGLLSHHPDSGIRFESFIIPYLDETVTMCINAHHLFYTNFLLGWDVAITDSGPVIVEVNEKPGMNVLQCTMGGLAVKLHTNYEKYLSKTQIK